jgi:UV excision repair protein RAD23
VNGVFDAVKVMIVTIKTLSQETFKIEVDGAEKVLKIKEKIKEIKSYEIQNQKLIYAGKILADDSSVESYKITETGFLVVMHTPKVEPAPALPTAASVLLPAPDSPVEPDTPTAETSDDSSQEQRNAQFDESTLLVGPGLQDAVDNIVNMGFSESLVRRALVLCFNNPDRAVELLVNDDPRLQEPVDVSPATGASPMDESGGLTAPAPTPSSTPASGLTAEEAGQLDFLRRTPQFQNIRALIQGNPNLLQPLLMELQNSNPELFEAINDNREEFIRLLNSDEEPSTPAAGGGAAGAALASADPAVAGVLPPNVIQVSLTPEENDKISTIMSVGNVPRQMAIQIFLMCDRDEMKAINYIFDNPEDL